MSQWNLSVSNEALAEAKSLANAIVEASEPDDKPSCDYIPQYSWNNSVKPDIIGYDVNLKTGMATLWLPMLHCQRITQGSKPIYVSIAKWMRGFAENVFKIVVRNERNEVCGRIVENPDGKATWEAGAQASTTAQGCPVARPTSFADPSYGPILNELL
jgi:hypothetical protein